MERRPRLPENLPVVEEVFDPEPVKASPSEWRRIGEPVAYALGQWPGLTAYLEDGRVEIDNNTVENAIRPTALGKKNWLFVGEAGAGERGAIHYTLIKSCRRRGLDPYAYLKDVLTRLPSMTTGQVADVTPAARANTRLCPHKIAA